MGRANVLVIDDSMVIRQQVGRALAPAGFSIVEAKDGIEGLQRLADSPDVRVIVCDVNMPRMNGLDFLERLAAKPQVPPVVMLTTEGQHDVIQRAKALGAKGWLIKPLKAENLVATVKRLATSAV